MAKRIEPLKPQAKAKAVKFQLPDLNAKGYLFLTQFWQQALIIGLLSILFYYNSKDNEYALDDDIVMRQNVYVQKGFGGISEIMGNDAYKSFYQSMGVEQQLSGGRYRPLSIVSFAIEQDLFGQTYGERFEQVRDSLFEMQKKGISDIGSQSRLIGEKNILELQIKDTNMAIAPHRHIMQIFWFALSMIVLLRFLRNHVFRGNTDLAFITTLLFVIHPIHTEVIANVKSRDEIFSLMFIVLTMDYFFRYDMSRKVKDAWYGVGFFLLALLSKEYAALLVFLIPLGLMIFHRRKLSDLYYLAVPLGGMIVGYLIIRGVTVGYHSEPVDKKNQDPLNDPYMYCKGVEKFASKLNRLDDYVWLLLFPFPLVADYSYQHFPYSDLGDPMVYLSVAIMGGMLWGTWKLWKMRHPMAFAMLFFWAFFMLINNMLFDIGATMGERLIYHSSLGFCMLLAWGLVWLSERFISRGDVTIDVTNSGSQYFAPLSRKLMIVGFVAVVGVPAFLLTQERNLEWKNDETLFIADVKKHPNSALTNGNAGARYMDRGLKYLSDTTKQDSVNYYADLAIVYLNRAVELHPRYTNGWLNLGLCYYNKKDYAKAAAAWEKVYGIFPSNPILQSYAQMLIAMANQKAAVKDYEGASEFFKYGLQAYPADSKIWLDYAGSSFMAQNFAEAKIAFEQAIQHTNDPAMQANIQQGYRAAHYNDSVRTKWLIDSLSYENNIAVVRGIIGTPDFYPQAHRNLQHALDARPGDVTATKLMDSLGRLEAKLKPPPAVQPPVVKDTASTVVLQPDAKQSTTVQPVTLTADQIAEQEEKESRERELIILSVFLFVALAGFTWWFDRKDRLA